MVVKERKEMKKLVAIGRPDLGRRRPGSAWCTSQVEKTTGLNWEEVEARVRVEKVENPSFNIYIQY